MGCQGSKNLQISNNIAFQNGKIMCKEGNYYLERSRYHDKLNPNVQKRFDNFFNDHIEEIT